MDKRTEIAEIGLAERAQAVTADQGQGDFPVEWDDPSEAALEWSWDDMHFPQPLTPLSGDYITQALLAGIDYRYQQAGLPLQLRSRIINGYAYLADKLLVPEDQMPAIMETSKQHKQQLSRELRGYWDNVVKPTLRESYDWMQNVPIETAPLPELAEAWERLWREAKDIWRLHFAVVAGAYQALNDLSDLYESLVEGAQARDALMLVQGLAGDLQNVQLDLHLLAEQASHYPDVAAAILNEKSLDDVASVKGGAEFMQSLHIFLSEHGHLGQPFEDLAYPSWADEPSLLIAEVRKRLVTPDADPETRLRKLRAESSERATQVRERLRDRPEDLERFEAALALAQDVGPLTEDHNYAIDRMAQALLHRFALRMGGRLVAAGVLAEPADIFYLRFQEVEDVLGEPRDMCATVIGRKADLERWRAVKPPPYLGKPPSPPQAPNRFSPEPEAQTEAGVLKGIGACAGVGRGPARVVLTLDDFERVQAGDILVSPASNPSWVPLFGIIAGLVTNTGGVLAHAAVTAREFGVPAVVGTGKATTVIKDGQMVEVDGAAGIVRILS